MRRREIEILCEQETKWKGDRARTLEEGVKMIHAGGDGKSNGVGVIMSETISKEIVRVERWNGRIVMIWIRMNNQMIYSFSLCASSWKTKNREAGVQ